MTIDIEAPSSLIPYLRVHRLILPDETPQVRVLTGGVANKTVLVEHANGAFVMKQALSKFRVQAEWLVQPQRSHIEVLGLQAYGRLCPSGSVPTFLFEDKVNFIHAMSAIPQPHDNYKEVLLRGEGRLELIKGYAALMAHVHTKALEHESEFRPIFEDLQYFESQRLQPFYAYTAEQVPQVSDFIHALIEETRRTQLTLVHGDFTPKNVLVRDGKLVLLDFEIVHWGDPAFDAGLALAHLLAKAIHVQKRSYTYQGMAMQFSEWYLRGVETVFERDDLERRLIAHTLVCLLARVRGKSPMNYLDEVQKTKIAEVVVRLIQDSPLEISEVCRFVMEGVYGYTSSTPPR